MGLSVLIEGRLVARPELRQSKAGRPFATALLAAATEGGASVLCSLVAFRDEAVTALLQLEAGGDAGRVRGGKLEELDG